MSTMPRVCFVAVLCVLLTGCGYTDTETGRVSNATKTLEVVIARREPADFLGATASNAVALYVACGGCRYSGQPVFVGDRIEDLGIFWTSPVDIKISARRANVIRSEDTIRIDGKTVRLDYAIEDRQSTTSNRN